MRLFVVLITQLATHLGLKFNLGQVIAETFLHTDHIQELLDSKFIKNLDDMNFYKVVHHDTPNLRMPLQMGDIAREDFFGYVGEADSFETRGYIKKLTGEEVAALPDKTQQVIPVKAAEEAPAPEAEKPVKTKKSKKGAEEAPAPEAEKPAEEADPTA